MYAVVVLFLASWIGIVVAQLSERNLAIVDAEQQQVRASDMGQVAAGLRSYIAQFGTSPASLAALVATPGYEYLRTARDPRQGYVVSGPLNDGVWTYTRTALVGIDLRRTTIADYLTLNACGSGAASSAPAWCGQASSGTWWRYESRQDAATQLFAARRRLNRNLQLFADYYNAKKAFPGVDGSGNPLPLGSVTPLTSLVGYGGGASNCSGAYAWSSLPLGCDDLYDRWGGAVGYAYFDPKHIALVAISPIRDSAGTLIQVVADFDLD